MFAGRIFLLNLYYPPNTSATAKMAQTIVDALSAAHEVTVVCGRPSYEPTERRAWRLWRTETTGGLVPSGNVKIIRGGWTDYSRTGKECHGVDFLTHGGIKVGI